MNKINQRAVDLLASKISGNEHRQSMSLQCSCINMTGLHSILTVKLLEELYDWRAIGIGAPNVLGSSSHQYE